MSALKQRENPGRSKPRVPSLGCSEPCTKPKLQPQVPLRASSLPSMGSSSRKIGGENPHWVLSFGCVFSALLRSASPNPPLLLPCSSPDPLLVPSWSCQLQRGILQQDLGKAVAVPLPLDKEKPNPAATSLRGGLGGQAAHHCCQWQCRCPN